MTEQEILLALREIAEQLKDTHPSRDYAIKHASDTAAAEESIQDILYSAIKAVGGKDCASCTLTVTSESTAAPEVFNLDIFQDDYGPDVRLAGFLPVPREIKSVSELFILDQQTSPTRLILIHNESDSEAVPNPEGEFVVAGVECYADLTFASISRALLNLSIATLAVSSTEA